MEGLKLYFVFDGSVSCLLYDNWGVDLDCGDSFEDVDVDDFGYIV